MKEAITKYVRNCKSLTSKFSFEESRPASSKAPVKTMRTGMREIETRLDQKLHMLSAQFENLTLILNKKRVEPVKSPIRCTFCKREIHYSNQCGKNPMENSRCGHCHRMRHTSQMCFQNQMSISRNCRRSGIKPVKRDKKMSWKGLLSQLWYFLR